MRDTKFQPLLVISALFLIVSFVLLCILGYNFFTQQKGGKPVLAVVATPAIINPAVEKTRDTLQQLYAATVNNISPDTSIDSTFNNVDTTQVSLGDNKVADYYKLKNEISTLLKDSSSAADLELARLKIQELQFRVDELKNRNVGVEKENKRLRALLEQMALNNNNTVPATVATRPVIENVNSSSSIFSASDLKLNTSNNNETEGANAEETEKFVGSLVVRNSLVQGMGEVVLVLIQPDGKVLRNAWESGSFDTDGGKKIYSRKIKFDYNKGESRRINFSMTADSIQKGTYTLQVYNNGKVIARATKSVS